MMGYKHVSEFFMTNFLCSKLKMLEHRPLTEPHIWQLPGVEELHS
jgi:hypothetical protein